MHPSIHSVLEETIRDHPNHRFYNPNLETFAMGCQAPGDELLAEWQAEAFERHGERRLRYITLPGTLERFSWNPRFLYQWGQSGWDYVHNVAHFVTLEFDHSDSHTHNANSTEQLNQAADFLRELPYVDLTRSTGGKGLHVRIQSEQYPCVSRSEYLSLRKRMAAYLQKLGCPGTIDPHGRAILWLWRAGQ